MLSFNSHLRSSTTKLNYLWRFCVKIINEKSQFDKELLSCSLIYISTIHDIFKTPDSHFAVTIFPRFKRHGANKCSYIDKRPNVPLLNIKEKLVLSITIVTLSYIIVSFQSYCDNVSYAYADSFEISVATDEITIYYQQYLCEPC